MNVWAILGTVVTGLLFVVVQWIKEGQAKRTGAELEAGKVNEATAKAQTAIAQAEVDAPDTQAKLADKLKAGKF